MANTIEDVKLRAREIEIYGKNGIQSLRFLSLPRCFNKLLYNPMHIFESDFESNLILILKDNGMICNDFMDNYFNIPLALIFCKLIVSQVFLSRSDNKSSC